MDEVTDNFSIDTAIANGRTIDSITNDLKETYLKNGRNENSKLYEQYHKEYSEKPTVATDIKLKALLEVMVDRKEWMNKLTDINKKKNIMDMDIKNVKKKKRGKGIIPKPTKPKDECCEDDCRNFWEKINSKSKSIEDGFAMRKKDLISDSDIQKISDNVEINVTLLDASKLKCGKCGHFYKNHIRDMTHYGWTEYNCCNECKCERYVKPSHMRSYRKLQQHTLMVKSLKTSKT